jgi:hypothetical protein
MTLQLLQGRSFGLPGAGVSDVLNRKKTYS